MKNCVPKGHQIVITVKAFLEYCTYLKDITELTNHSSFWVYWPGVLEAIGDQYLSTNELARKIIQLWEKGFINELSGDAELPAIIELNNTDPYCDNVSVYCASFAEYVKLREYYGEEDVIFIRRT